MRIYLTGFMGAGKSTVGRALAARLGCTFVDLDAQIEQSARQSIVEVFQQVGEQGFRALESVALSATLELDRAVVATGGGALVSSVNRGLLGQEDRVVWLNVPFPLIVDRLLGDRSRPLFADLEQAEHLYRERLGSYRLCDLEIRVDSDVLPEDIAQRIIDEIS